MPAHYPILLPRGEMRAAVFLPALLVVVGTLRAFLAVADGLQLIAGNTQLHQEFLSRRGPPVAESQIVLRGPALVAMAFDRHAGIREAGEDGLQGIRIFG